MEHMGIGKKVDGDHRPTSLTELGKRYGLLSGPAEEMYLSTDETPATPEEILSHWVGLWRDRISQQWHNVIAITGEAGSGKSTLALRLAQDMEPEFDPRTQVAYSALDMVRLYKTLGKNRVAIYDEAVLGLMSRDYASPDAKELLKVVNIVRAKGVTVLLNIPHLMRLDAGWRDENVRYWIHCSSDPRGIALVHERDPRLRYNRRPPPTLGLYKEPRFNPLTWKSLEGTTFWNTYQSAKLARIQEFLGESEERLSERTKRVDVKHDIVIRMLESRHQTGLTQHQIAKLTGSGNDYVSGLAREVDTRRRERPSPPTPRGA